MVEQWPSFEYTLEQVERLRDERYHCTPELRTRSEEGRAPILIVATYGIEDEKGQRAVRRHSDVSW